MAGATPALESASPPLWRVLARRTVFAVLLIAITCVPFAVFGVISGEIASSLAASTGLAAVMVLALAGQAYAYLVAGLFAALTPIAIVSGAVPVAGAALVGLMCFGVGVSAAWGLNRGFAIVPMWLMFLIIAPPPWSGLTGDDRTSTSYLLWNTLFMGGGALWAALVLPPILRKRKMPMPLRPPQPWARADVVAYTITITVLCGASTLAVLYWWPGSDPGWLPVTVLAATGLGIAASVKRTLNRIGGTIIGFVIAVIVASVVDSEAVLIAIALVLAVVCVVVVLSSPSYLLFETFVVPVVVLLTATSIADVDKTDRERLAAVLVGGALVLIATGITLGWAHYKQAQSPSAVVES